MAIHYTDAGVVYSGTQSPAQAAGSGVSYTLDDYEVGTYTGAFGGVTSSNTGTAYYTKIGQRVFCNWYSSSVTIEGASGSATVLGHPFTAGGGNNYSVFSYCHGNAVDGNSRGGFIEQSEVTWKFLDDQTPDQSTYINGASKYIMVAGQYWTAS